MKKGPIIAGVLILAVAAGAGGGWYYYQKNGDFGVLQQYIDKLPLDQIPFFGGDEDDSDAVYVTAVSTLMGTNTGLQNRYAGVVEPQDTVSVQIDSGRKVKQVHVKTGDVVKRGQLLFEYDLTSIQEDLQEARLDLDRLKNEAISIQDQIKTLEKEKKKAKQNAQLSYTIEIETNKMNLKKNEYDQISKEAQIEKLERATGNTEVRSEIDGLIQKIDNSKMATDDSGDISDTIEEDSYYQSDSGDGAFITILSTGEYRVKGTINELNINSLTPGQAVIIRSRMDETQTWKGMMGNIDRENASTSGDSSSYFGFGGDSSDSQTSSSSYPFYVEMDSSDGMMLGQHVYIELDEGQEEAKKGVWLTEFFIADAETDSPYVWAASDKNRLEKRPVVLGEYDENLEEYEILEGLSEDDRIAFPASGLEEGMKTVLGTAEETMEAMFEDYEDEEYSDEDLEGEDFEDEDYEDEEYEDYEEEYDDEGIEEIEVVEGDEEIIEDSDWEVLEEEVYEIDEDEFSDEDYDAEIVEDDEPDLMMLDE
ncbi:MAG: efflux RND transporter periplasmic adaptor subunit [Blautia sp.]|nr:efflux RND transporter periplasmic adaptor subunit [Blautia sp.]